MLNKLWVASCAVVTGLFCAESARGQDSGSLVGWGSRVVVPPSALTDLIAVDASEHNLGLTADGSIVAWGANYFWQSYVPEPNSNFVAVAAGFTHSLGLRADGSIAAWGNNTSRECNARRQIATSSLSPEAGDLTAPTAWA